MKVAVLHEIGGIPRYEDFPDPVAGEGEVIIDVKAVAVENVDKAIAAGTHYTSTNYLTHLPMIPAFDGIGALPDGTLVGFGNIGSPYGALAEKAVVPRDSYIPIPDGIDPAVATVLGSAITGMSITTAAGFVPGETVLVQGATGVAGRLAVKVARLLGAGRIVATGRDDEQLREVLAIGADTVINTAVPDEALTQAYTDAKGDGYDIVVDYLWGPAHRDPAALADPAVVRVRKTDPGDPDRRVGRDRTHPRRVEPAHLRRGDLRRGQGPRPADHGRGVRADRDVDAVRRAHLRPGAGPAERHRDRLAADRPQGQATRRGAVAGSVRTAGSRRRRTPAPPSHRP